MRTRRTMVPQSERRIDIPRMLLLLGIEFKDHGGGELWACCPFPDHNEKTASWSIKPDGRHYCFGCKEGGGAVELVRKVYGFASWSLARSWVEEHGLFEDGALPLEVDVQVTRPSLDLPEVIPPRDARFLPLKDWITPARRYAEKRGITPAQVERWGLGYAAGGYYRGRLLLPTREHGTGRLLNITGRAWDRARLPKYLNSREEDGWDPGAVFGEQHWPPYLSRATLVLCEGELNALACERAGAMLVGALGGSQLENEQVLKLSRFRQIIIAVDMDRAGTEVAEALKGTISRWQRCRQVEFPDDRDPNDLEREDPTLLKKLLWGPR